MRARFAPVLFVGSMFVLPAAAASAQPSTHPRGLQPVSPGGFAVPTLSAACPAFSWAGRPGAIGYELAVHRLDDGSQLEPEPVMRVTLPGTAATWAPPVSDCLEPGSDYMWFIREVGAAGEPRGGWSDGMRFTVAGPARSAAADGDSSEPIVALKGTGNENAGNGGGNSDNDPPPTNREILTRIQAVLDKLNEPEPIFSFVLCTEPAFQGELAAGSQLKLNGEIEGRAGAEAFGSGAIIKLQGEPASKLDGSFKGAWDIAKLGVCWDLGATVRNRRAAAAAGGATLRAAAAPADLADIVGALDTEDLRQKLQAVADKLQLDPAGFVAGLDSITDVAFDGDPFAAVGDQGPLKTLVRSLPLPQNLRTLADNPGALLDRFRDLRSQGLCNANLPPALAGPVGEICDLVANEPFKPLLARVDKATDTIESIVDRIEKALPNSESCKFFCDGGFLGK